MTNKIFFLDESPYQPGKYTIRMNFDLLPSMTTSGSFNLLPARLLNLSYADYLRFCRDVYKAEIIGKNSMYPVAYFKNDAATGELIRTLNERISQIEKRKE